MKPRNRLIGFLFLVICLGAVSAVIVIRSQVVHAHEMFLRREAFARVIKNELDKGITQGQLNLLTASVNGPGSNELQDALRRITDKRVSYVTFNDGDKTFFFIFHPEPLTIISHGIVSR
jgi:hypothetical protein